MNYLSLIRDDFKAKEYEILAYKTIVSDLPAKLQLLYRKKKGEYRKKRIFALKYSQTRHYLTETDTSTYHFGRNHHILSLAHHGPYLDFSPCPLRYFVCAYDFQQTTHSTSHRNDIGRRTDRKARIQPARARRLVRTLRQSRHLLHHVPCWLGRFIVHTLY